MREEYPYDSPGQEALELGMIIAGLLVLPIIFVTVYWFRLTSMVEMIAVVLANMVVVFGVVPVVMARCLGRPLDSLVSGETGVPWKDEL